VRISGALAIDRADVAAKPPTPTGVVTLDVVERNRPPDLDLDHALEPVRQTNGVGRST